jgi:hypothetical protein
VSLDDQPAQDFEQAGQEVPDEELFDELLGLLAEEFTSGGMACHVVPRSDEVVPAQLVMPLGTATEDDGVDLVATVQICFLPGQVEPPVMQYFVALDVDVPDDALGTTALLLHRINVGLPIGGFELSDTAGAVAFRHCQSVTVRPLEPMVVAWPISMLHYAVTTYAGVIAAAAAGAEAPELIPEVERLVAQLLED